MFRTFAAATLAGSLALAAAPAQAQAKPDLEKAKQIASQVCAACHGADGASPTPANPSIAGMPADYITRQLVHFKSGVRVNPVMQGMVAALTDADLVALGAFYAQQKPKPNEAKDGDLARAGQRLWRAGDQATGLPACSACHGPTGAGIPRAYPRIGGQWADYTYAQLKAFKAGERGADPGGKDVNGRIMAAIARSMTDAQMKASAEFAQGLR
jgi:cytochrome c553